MVATTDGLETNIGKDCGKSYFGVVFEELARTFDRDVLERDYRAALWSLRFREDGYTTSLLDLRQNGGDWVYKNLQPLQHINRGCPTAVVRELERMVKRRDGAVIHEREATREELDLEETRTGRRPRSLVVSKVVGTIDGIEALFPENDLRQLMILDLEARLGEFAGVDIDSLPLASMRTWAIWSSNIEGMLVRIAELRDIGRRLLTRDNLRVLGRDLKTEDRAMYETYLRDLSALPQ